MYTLHFYIGIAIKDECPVPIIALVQGFDRSVLQSNLTEAARLRAEMFPDEVFSWSLQADTVLNLKVGTSEVSQQWPANGRDSPTHSDVEIAAIPA